ncbi:MAG: D-2-hydroxyacid dehydrogenase [Bacteroidetes bacterium]|nr:D-2-hydroxyacid dehydrogenase [Fibrella sp.]
MTIFVHSRLSEAGKTYLRAQLPTGTTLVFGDELPDNQQPAALAQADILLGNPRPDWLTGPLSIRWWQLDSAGFDAFAHVDVSFPVTNMGDLFAWPCAETIVAGVMALYRHIHELARLQTEQRWVGVPIRPTLQLLRGQRVIILGAGTIGQAVAQILQGFDCQIQFLARTNPQAALHTADELRAALPVTDLVINCLPGNLTNYIDAGQVAAMKPGSVFANVGRGSTVDETALIRALQTGQLGGAVLDVTAIEPLPADNPLWTLPNVILTQHTGGGQPHEERAKLDRFLANWHRFQTGEPLVNQVTLARGY